MNFASLLKQHQNRLNHQPYPSHHMIKINCNISNIKSNNPIIQNHKPTINHKKKLNSNLQTDNHINQPNNISKLIDIYFKYEDDPTTQWILQQDNYSYNKMRLHRFKPSKVKLQIKNQSHTKTTNPNNNHYPLSNHFMLSSKQQQYLTSNGSNIRDDQSCYSVFSQQIMENLPSQNISLENQKDERKNYSPMQRLNAKIFNQSNKNHNNNNNHKNHHNDNNNNKINLNNKVSFAEDQIWKFNQNNQYDERQNNQINQKRQNNQINQSNNYQGINLMQKFNQCQKQSHKQPENNINNVSNIDKLNNNNNLNNINSINNINLCNENNTQVNSQTQNNANLNQQNTVNHRQQNTVNLHQQQKKQLITTHKNQQQLLNQPQSIQRIIKNSKQPQSLNFDLQVDLSFKENKLNQSNKLLNNLNKFCQSFNIESQEVINNQHDNEKIKNNNSNIIKKDIIKQVDQFLIREVKELERTIQCNKHSILVDSDKNKSQSTSIKIINLQEPSKNTAKPISQTEPKRDRSPNHIICRANIKTLTPQKYKLSKVDSLMNVNQKNQSLKGKTQNLINLQWQNGNKVENGEIQNKIKIDKIEKDNINAQNKEKNQNQDKIKRIVIFDENTTKKQSAKNEENKVGYLEKTPEIKSNLSNLPYQNLNKLINQFSSLPSHNMPSQTSNQPNSIRSPPQQKPKIYNQLLNLQSQSIPSSQQSIPSENVIKSPPQITTYNHPSGIPSSNNGQITAANNGGYIYRPLGINGMNNGSNNINNVGPYSLSSAQNSTQPHNTYQTVINPSNNHIPPISNQFTSVKYQNTQPQYEPRISTYSPYFPVNQQKLNEPNRSPVSYQPYSFNSQIKYQTAGNKQISPSINVLPPQTTFIKTSSPVYNFATNTVQYPIAPSSTINQVHFLNNNKNPILPPYPPKSASSQQDKQNDDFLKFQGIKKVQSKIYQAPLYQVNKNIIKNMKSDPKQASVDFSLRSNEPFEGLKVIGNN